MLRSLLMAATGLAVLAFVPSACSGPGTSADPGAVLRVELFDYRGAKSFELVSESHTQRLEQYSQVRENAGRKVQKDEVMLELVERIHEFGFDRLALQGDAPESSGDDVFWSLEVQEPSGTRYVLYRRNMIAGDANACRAMKADFLGVYNQTYALQAVDVKVGETPFETPARKKKD